MSDKPRYLFGGRLDGEYLFMRCTDETWVGCWHFPALQTVNPVEFWKAS